jgi:hypothetical protein
MESCFHSHAQVVQQKMAIALNLLANNGAWWYSLYGLQQDTSSFACLLGINDSMLPMVYEYCGWLHIYATKGSNQPQRYLKKGFHAFKASNYLNIECEKTAKQFYIRIGTFSKGTGVFSMHT